MGQAPTLLICTAHPDDETFGSGGMTAVLAARGVAVHTLLATSGQAGEITDPALDTPANRANLGALREAEARAAGRVLGTTEVHFLRHVDGQLAAVGDEPLAREVATVIRQVRPHVVVTFGPDGVYGHPDHVAIHRATRLAWDLAADEAEDLGGQPPHAAARLFYQVIPVETAEKRNADRGPILLDGVPHTFFGYPPEAITTRVDASDVREKKIAALACHHTQTARRLDQIRAMYGDGLLVENYLLAVARVPDAPGLATDPFAGL